MSVIILVIIVFLIIRFIRKKKYKELENNVLMKLGFQNWNVASFFDDHVVVKSRASLEKYDEIKYFKEDKGRLSRAESVLQRKKKIETNLKDFLNNNEFKTMSQYNKIEEQIKTLLDNTGAYRLSVTYISSAGNNLGSKGIALSEYDVNRFKNDPTLLMNKGEYNKYIREQNKEILSNKQHEFYNKVNDIIDLANSNRDLLVVDGAQKKLDTLIEQLFDRTVNSIKKIKAIDSEEWDIIGSFIDGINVEINSIIEMNQKILEYYDSENFSRIKSTCETLMSTQRDFNEYINEKVQSVAKLFGTRVVRNETVNDDEYGYIRPYKKAITPFTAEVSATVFASAENDPLEYVVKKFYPDKKAYPEQIKKLYHLVEELETLKDAKKIIENYKKDYQKYLGDVPEYIIENDESGFYSRLGFANIDEGVFNVEYTFAYTSGGGMARRTFGVPMTEENIAALITKLESKLTASAFAKEQRNLMTKKLREHIKKRDNYACCNCGNSIEKEPNLLLEIDHIIPVSKGGCTVEDNLQTLCWKCNRAKSNKLV